MGWDWDEWQEVGWGWVEWEEGGGWKMHFNNALALHHLYDSKEVKGQSKFFDHFCMSSLV